MFGSFWIAVLVSALVYGSDPDAWPGDVIAWGVGTFAALVGLGTFSILFEGKIGELKISFSKGDTPTPADGEQEQDV